MVWDASLGGNNSPEEERQIAADLVKLASKHGVGVSFWTSNEPIDISQLGTAEETTNVVPNQPPLKPKDEAPKQAKIETHKATAKKAAKK